RRPIVLELKEGVVFFGREPGLRLEPVREVRRTARDRPVLDRLCDRGRNVGIQLLSLANRSDKLLVDTLRHLAAHLADAEGVDPEVLRDPLGESCSVLRRTNRTARDFAGDAHAWRRLG